MPKWFKLDQNFLVRTDALLNPCGDLWRYLKNDEQFKEQIENEETEIVVLLSQYRDNGYGVYDYAHVALYGTLKTLHNKQYVIFKRYNTEQPYSTLLQDADKNEAYETLVLWSIDLIKESNKICKIPSVTFKVDNETITTTKPIYKMLKGWLRKKRRVFRLICHDLGCVTEYFVAKKQDDHKSVQTQDGKTVVYAGCPRHPNSTAHVKHTIGELNDVEITKQNMKVIKQHA